MLSIDENLRDDILSCVRECFNKGDSGADAVQITSLITNILETVLNSVNGNKFHELSDRCNEQEKRSDELDRQIERQNKQIEDQEEKLVSQAKQVNDLTHRVTRLERYYRSSEISRVRDNVIIKSTKTTQEISEYLADTIKKGCGEKPSLHLFSIQLIVQKKGVISPGKPSKKTKPESLLYKVRLSPKMKSDLFRGLSANARANTDFQVSHDTPRFLVQQKHAYEKIAFSIRSAHKKNLEVKTRISLRSQNLALMIKTKDLDWFDIDSESANDLLETLIVLKDGETMPQGVKSVGDLKNTIVHF